MPKRFNAATISRESNPRHSLAKSDSPTSPRLTPGGYVWHARLFEPRAKSVRRSLCSHASQSDSTLQPSHVNPTQDTPLAKSDSPTSPLGDARQATSGRPDNRGAKSVRRSFYTACQPTHRTATSHRDSFRLSSMYHVYIITSQSNTQRYYIGFSSRPNERLQEHNDGKNPSLPPSHPGL